MEFGSAMKNSRNTAEPAETESLDSCPAGGEETPRESPPISSWMTSACVCVCVCVARIDRSSVFTMNLDIIDVEMSPQRKPAT